MSVEANAPSWAQWRTRSTVVRAWARIPVVWGKTEHIAEVLSIGFGWVSVRAEQKGEPKCALFRSEHVKWTEAELLPECIGIEVTKDGQTHRLLRSEKGDRAIGRWVARAVEIGASVEGLTAEQ